MTKALGALNGESEVRYGNCWKTQTALRGTGIRLEGLSCSHLDSTFQTEVPSAVSVTTTLSAQNADSRDCPSQELPKELGRAASPLEHVASHLVQQTGAVKRDPLGRGLRSCY